MNTSESGAAPTDVSTDMPRGLTAVVLAGGRSSRFGSDKARAVLLGRPLLDWVVAAVAPVCPAVVIVKAIGQQLPPVVGDAILEVQDLYRDGGPLAAVVTGFGHCRTSHAFVVGCDTPALVAGLVPFLFERVAAYAVALPILADTPQPLCAVYDVAACKDPFRVAVEERRLGLIAAIAERSALRISEEELRGVDPDLRSFLNANTAEALAEIASLLMRERGVAG